MLNGRYTSVYEVIRNVIRDTGMTNEVQWQDAVEWSWEVISLIGVPHTLVNRHAIICIDDYRGELPCDLDTLVQVSGITTGGFKFPMRESTNSFHPVYECKLDSDDSIPDNTPGIEIDTMIGGNSTFAVGSNLVDTNTPIGEDANGNPTFNFMNDTNVTLSKFLAGTPSVTSNLTDPTYTINDNFIFTSFREGYNVIMAYKAFPIDNKGLPLIPDDVKFKLAVKCFITMKIDYILWRRGDLPRDVYEHSEREWAWYCGAATTKARIPSYDKMESIKNSVMKLIPKLDQHANGFMNLGSKERLLYGRKY